ncbi:TIGR04282 family arsenosugar biosynthesis glycosyltransferase [Micromonospora sp. SD12]|uniref:TIGR04282 family arsenosugar biosynthesis glycosyltransferase n=1 Tax=Micromonospora sp. SD12 TaxID=3452216 RepID=UPI003F8ABD96
MTVVLVMAKAPVPGLVKTRLCPPATPVQAAELAAAALRDTLDAVRETPGVTPVLALAGHLAEAVDGVELTAALAGWSVLPQRGTDLADRLAHAHLDVAETFPDRRVLQIGMDTPQLTPARLAAAMCRLEDADAALGYAHDGGWWALGLRDPRQAVMLRAVPMSTPDTGRSTWSALTGRGLRAVPLPVLRDVDNWSDARDVAAAIPDGRFARQVEAVRRAMVVRA